MKVLLFEILHCSDIWNWFQNTSKVIKNSNIRLGLKITNVIFLYAENTCSTPVLELIPALSFLRLIKTNRVMTDEQ